MKSSEDIQKQKLLFANSDCETGISIKLKNLKRKTKL